MHPYIRTFAKALAVPDGFAGRLPKASAHSIVISQWLLAKRSLGCADRAVLADRRANQPQDRGGRVGRWRGRPAGRAHRSRSSRTPGLYAAEPVSHAAVLRGLCRRGRESLGTAETNPLDAPSHHPWAEQAARGARVLSGDRRQQKWSSRQLERQFKLALFERAMATPPKVSAALRHTHPDATNAFKDTYVLGSPDWHPQYAAAAAILGFTAGFIGDTTRDQDPRRQGPATRRVD